MYKKITSLMLAFLLCCFTIFAVSSGVEYSYFEESNLPCNNAGSAAINETLLSDDAFLEDYNPIIDSTITDRSEYYEKLYNVPEEILSASTAELLEYFMESPFMTEEVMSYYLYSTPYVIEKNTDYSLNKAYSELVSREDCLEALNRYADSLIYDSVICEQNKNKIEKVLDQPLAAQLLSALEHDPKSYPYLQYVYASVKSSSSLREEDDDISTENYYYVEINIDRSEYYEKLYNVPEEILSASTAELLEYFMESPFMTEEVMSCYLYSTPYVIEKNTDYSLNKAYSELVSREDCLEALNRYADSLIYDSVICEQNKNKIEKVLDQPLAAQLLSALEHDPKSYPYLQYVYASVKSASSTSVNSLATTDVVRYYSAGTISTANGRSVEVYAASRELTSSEIAYINSDVNNRYNYAGNMRLSNPSSKYNCHSYAWYRFSTANPYWIMDISQFLLDSGCTKVATASAQVNDIIVYKNSDGQPVHSGVVYSISSSGELTIRSKWGQAGVYLHSIKNVPETYYSDYGNRVVNYDIYRYHDYENEATGNHYHSGGRHFYEYADVCKVCRKQINTTWKGFICDGPPCAVILAAQID